MEKKKEVRCRFCLRDRNLICDKCAYKHLKRLLRDRDLVEKHPIINTDLPKIDSDIFVGY